MAANSAFRGSDMAKSPNEDEVLKRMLKTPPKPFTPKKGKPGGKIKKTVKDAKC